MVLTEHLYVLNKRLNPIQPLCASCFTLQNDMYQLLQSLLVDSRKTHIVFTLPLFSGFIFGQKLHNRLVNRTIVSVQSSRKLHLITPLLKKISLQMITTAMTFFWLNFSRFQLIKLYYF
jgi:hypothetical protein